MADHFLVKIFEHNNWANLQMIQTCSTLTDEQLDAEPHSATRGSIRRTLLHLAGSQQGYLALLTLPVEARLAAPPEYDELERSVTISGEGLLALARAETIQDRQTRLQTTDGFYVEPWVVMLQVINHATEHREQINSMLTALGIPPLDLDGWAYGEATQALIPVPGL